MASTEAPTSPVAPPSSVPVPPAEPETGPSTRWETAFVYAFICKFTKLRRNVEGFETPMDLEKALLVEGSDPVLIAVLGAFIGNLKPTIRDPHAKLEKNLNSILEEYCNKENERSLWWNEEIRRNVNPLHGTSGFWSLGWEKKLAILRQLVDWQLTYCTRIKEMLDLAWGVKAAKHQKKIDKEANAPPPPDHPESKEMLKLEPVGQDMVRKRYWAVDDSPRLYQSGNPWKSSCTFFSVSSTRDEFLKVVEDLKERAPATGDAADGGESKASKAKAKLHLELIGKLENEQLPKVDAELQRAERARKKFEQKLMLAAQAEVRTTRTRRTTQRADYVYDYDELIENDDDYADDGPGSEDFIDDEMDLDESFAESSTGRRRSSRSAVVNTRNKRSSDVSTRSSYRGERRSTRLGNAPAIAFDESEQALLPPTKRARTDSSPAPSTGSNTNAQPVAAPLPAGKKKSRFWFYALEPVSGSNESTPAPSTPGPTTSGELTNGSNGHTNEAAPSETGTSLADGMEGVELADSMSATAVEKADSLNGSANGNAGEKEVQLNLDSRMRGVES